MGFDTPKSMEYELWDHTIWEYLGYDISRNFGEDIWYTICILYMYIDICTLTYYTVHWCTLILHPNANHDAGIWIPTKLGLLGVNVGKYTSTMEHLGYVYIDICLLYLYTKDMVYLYTSISGWWYTYPSEKYESQLGWWFPTEWKNETCSKPPARYVY